MNRRERRLAAKNARKTGAPTGEIAAALNQATAHHQAGRRREAEAGYRAILSAEPGQADALHQLGLLLAETGREGEGIAMMERAIAQRSSFVEARFNLGTVLHGIGHSAEAATHYRAVLEQKPDFIQALFNLATAEIDLGRMAEAEADFRKLLSREPGHALALNGLGVTLDEQGRFADAEAAFGEAIVADPGCTDAHVNLGNLLYDRGHWRDAAARYREAYQTQPNDAARIKEATVLPVIMGTREEVAASRQRFDENVGALLAENLSIDDPLAQIGMTGFYLAYHGLDDKRSQRNLGKLLLKSCPSLGAVAPHCESPAAPDGKISIGFISQHFSNHTIGRLLRGVIAGLDRKRFTVSVFGWPKGADEIGMEIAGAADKAIELPATLEGARAAIAGEKLDILYYADIGMEPFTYFLGFARLAPVQCAFWGHPMTTGLPNIDYFISSEDLEIAEGDDHYTEKLVRLETPAVSYRRPMLPEQIKSREDFGFEPDEHIYLCPQTLFKFHPDFDPLIGAILEGDEAGTLILIEGKHKEWQELLMARLRDSIGKATDRIRFLPRQGFDDFLGLLRRADVILDPPVFGGGNSTLEALAMGTPVVTLPDNYLRARISYTWYRKMSLMDCVAKDGEDYVRIALELGRNATRRAEVAKRITARADILFDDDDAVRGLEDFLVEAVRR